MNTYFLSITGNWWLLIVLGVVAVAFSIFSYRNTIPPISNKKRTLLVTLRSVALILLLFAIFEPIWTAINTTIVKPKIALVLDNSASMGTNDAGGSRLKQYEQLMATLDLSKFDTNVVVYKFGRDTKLVDSASSKDVFANKQLTLDENETDISQAIRTVANVAESQNIRAMVMVSDGAFNTGNNPIFDAENFALPIYTIGIGDTTEPKDVSITSILANEIAYIDNPIPVDINFSAAGYNGDIVKVTLSDDEQRIGEQEFTLNADRNNYTAIFEYLPTREGVRKLTATITHLAGEITDKNNAHSEYVRVLKNDRTVSIFSGSPSPDLAFIKRVLMGQKGVEVLDFVQKQGGTFYKTPTAADIAKTDIFVFCGFPVNSTPTNVMSQISAALGQGKSLLFVAGLNTDYGKLKAVDDYLPFSVINSKPQEFSATALINPDALASPILRVTGTDADVKLWDALQPIFRTETFVRTKPSAEVLATMKVNNVELKEPLIMTQQLQGNKVVAVLGYGLYRWKMMGYASSISKGKTDVPDLFATLIDNSFRWLAVRDKDKQVNVRTIKKHYNQGEKIEFVGDLYDAAFVPIEGANIKVMIGSGANSRNISMISVGNGRYYGSVEGLSKGDYTFTANAVSGSRQMGTDNGRFSVGELAIEFQNLKRNTALLTTLSDRTLGKFYEPDNTDKLTDDIMAANSFVDKPTSHNNEFLLWNWLGFLIAAILLFAAEWFIRKRTGLL